MTAQTKILFEVLLCLLKTAEMGCVENPSIELRKATVKYIESTVKMVEEYIKLEEII